MHLKSAASQLGMYRPYQWHMHGVLRFLLFYQINGSL